MTDKPWTIEQEGTIDGFNYIVLINHFGGTRNGYVQIPADHPRYGDDCQDLDVHGGITFDSVIEEEAPHHYLKPGYWIGFDCAHGMDGRDPDLMTEESKRFTPEYSMQCGPVRTKEYVLENITGLTEQLKKEQ